MYGLFLVLMRGSHVSSPVVSSSKRLVLRRRSGIVTSFNATMVLPSRVVYIIDMSIEMSNCSEAFITTRNRTVLWFVVISHMVTIFGYFAPSADNSADKNSRVFTYLSSNLFPKTISQSCSGQLNFASFSSTT